MPPLPPASRQVRLPRRGRQQAARRVQGAGHPDGAQAEGARLGGGGEGEEGRVPGAARHRLEDRERAGEPGPPAEAGLRGNPCGCCLLPGARRGDEHGEPRAHRGAVGGGEPGVPLDCPEGACGVRAGALLLPGRFAAWEPRDDAEQGLRAILARGDQRRGGDVSGRLPPEGALHGRVRPADRWHEERLRPLRAGVRQPVAWARVVRRQEGGDPLHGRQRRHPLREDGRRGPRADFEGRKARGRRGHPGQPPAGQVRRGLHAQLRPHRRAQERHLPPARAGEGVRPGEVPPRERPPPGQLLVRAGRRGERRGRHGDPVSLERPPELEDGGEGRQTPVGQRLLPDDRPQRLRGRGLRPR
mmetsp:Transcript_31997/g.95166  ORF Transcript_31997/g.95166 Transcript_31997/m.95166 type:complete len:358 (-) Transcript_31997:48-1121(-)